MSIPRFVAERQHGPPVTPPDLSARLRRACADLDRRLRAGADARAEEAFAADPELAADPDAAVELAYAEFAAREELGQQPDRDAFLARFPDLRAALADQLHVHALIRSEPPAANGTPTTVGPYRVVEQLSRGPGGRVYRAEHRDIGRVVALKLVPAEIARGAGEAWAAAQLEHPNVVRLYEVGTDPAGAYLAMEWVGGGTLADRLAGRPLSPAAAAAVVEPLARAAHHAHDRGVVHRDIKPANVLLGRNDDFGMMNDESKPKAVSGLDSSLIINCSSFTPKLSDFGLASTDGESAAGLAGTPSYMAPEQARGDPEVGPAADVYALGAVLYECLTGRPPFRADTPLHTLEQVVTEEPVPPRRLNPRVPRDLETVCLTCLRKTPARRYPSAAALADDLRRFLDGRPVAARPVGTLEGLWKWANRRPAVAGLLGLLAVAVVALAVGGAWTNARLRAARDAAEQDAADLRERYEAARRDVFTIQLAQANDLARTDPGRALALLDDPARCPPDLRDFAWGLLHHACRQDVRTIAAPGPATGLGFSPDGRRVRATVQRVPRTWEVATGEERPCDPDPPRPAGWTVRRDGQVAVVSDPSGLPTRVPLGFTPTVLAVSPDGRRLAAADSSHPPRLGVWEVGTGTPVAEIGGGHALRVSALAWSPDGQRLASGGQDRAVRVWAGDDLRQLANLRGHLDTVEGLAWAADGRSLASASDDRTVRVWRVGPDPAGPERTTGNDAKITAVEFAPDSRGLLAACADGTVKRWDLPLAGPPQMAAVVRTPLLALAVASDGRFAAGGDDGTVSVYAADGRPLRELGGHRARVRSLAWSPDGAMLASGGEDNRVGVWTSAGFDPAPAPPAAGPVRFVEFSADGRLLAVAAGNGTAVLWDATTRAVVASKSCHTKPVLFARFRPGAAALATGGMDYLVKLSDLPGLTERLILPGHSHYVFAAAFTPDGRSLVTGSGNRFENVPGDVRVWDAETGHLRAALAGQTGPLAVAPDGSALATVEEYTAVRLWRADPR